MAKHPDGALAGVKLACDDLKVEGNRTAWSDLLDAYVDLVTVKKVLERNRAMLRDAAQQFRELGEGGTAALYEKQAAAAVEALILLDASASRAVPTPTISPVPAHT